MAEILDGVFRHPDIEPTDEEAIQRELTNRLHASGPSIMQSEVDNWWPDTRQLFGNQAQREYSGNINWREVLDKERKKRGKSHK